MKTYLFSFLLGCAVQVSLFKLYRLRRAGRIGDVAPDGAGEHFGGRATEMSALAGLG